DRHAPAHAACVELDIDDRHVGVDRHDAAGVRPVIVGIDPGHRITNEKHHRLPNRVGLPQIFSSSRSTSLGVIATCPAHARWACSPRWISSLAIAYAVS